MPPLPKEELSRRRFLRLAAIGAAAAAGGTVPVLISCGESSSGPRPDQRGRSRLTQPGSIPASGATLIAQPGTVSVAGGAPSAALLFNGALPGPTIRARRGDVARIRLVNRLPEPTIVHWHGLIVPEVADGHPRNAIGAGATLDYAFPVVQRAGTFWYHPHPHGNTAAQIHRGLAGFFVVSDDEEDALRLPSGDREILLLLQDRDGDPARALRYEPTTGDMHEGMLRDVPFGNGVRLPTLDIVGARYRFRVLNGSQARVFRLALSDGTPLAVIGNDGGLLPAMTEEGSVFIGVGERVDFLLDFTDVPVGTRLMLKSLPFELPRVPGESSSQGAEMDVLELVRIGAAGAEGASSRPLPAILSSVSALGPPVHERTFLLSSTRQDAMHTINGRSFDMNRVDEQIPLGRVERWRFVNDSTLPHPVHLHGTHFQVESRIGGRNVVYAYERGWKDTVLVMPLETVDVLVRFDRYRGVFPLHCHNLQHEDMGMMLNVEVT